MPPSESRVAVLSDVHGNHVALSAVLEAVRGRVQHYLFLGDFCGYYPYVRECLALWPEHEILGVRGNHDQVLLEVAAGRPLPEEYRRTFGSALERALAQLSSQDTERLRALPPERMVTLKGVRLALYHGAPWDALNARVYPDFEQWERFAHVAADVILLGHTHHAMVRRVGKTWIINPGSVGQARDGKGARYAELSLPSCHVALERVDYDSSLLASG